VFFCNKAVTNAASDKLYTDVATIPYNKVGLLLGTSKYLRSGRINDYYRKRIEATVELVRAGKIKYIVISGDNSRKTYSEPEEMRNDLIAAGVDSNTIYLDYAGFRTFDSMVRLREIFSQQNVTVISQKFHNERALFIASKEGIEAIGFNAKDVSAYYGFRIQIREYLARVKVFVDYIIGKKPKFLGEKVLIPN
jgi:SanA protein